MSTDEHWEAWGQRDPYYGVITLPQFRSAALTHEARLEFFRSGHDHASHLLTTIRAHIDPTFQPQRALDFGCGVGRVLVGLANIAPQVVGMDVSPSMLAEARRNCDELGIPHVQLALSDDELSAVKGQFDFMHTFIVLQHLEIARGRLLFERLLQRIRPGGVGTFHVTYGGTAFDATFGQPPLLPPEPPAPPARVWFRNARGSPAPLPEETDPEMQMNYYNLSELMYLLHRERVSHTFATLTDHGGALGVMMFFRKNG